MYNEKFKSAYIAPLDHAHIDSNIVHKDLLEKYIYPFGNPWNVESDIQDSFNEKKLIQSTHFS